MNILILQLNDNDKLRLVVVVMIRVGFSMIIFHSLRCCVSNNINNLFCANWLHNIELVWESGRGESEVCSRNSC